MSRWWRAYDEAVDDPKLQKLPAELFRAWFNICCITSQNGGTLPAVEDIAFKLRLSVAKTEKLLADLRAAILIDDREDGTVTPHNWNGRQYKSDNNDPTNADRQRRYRERKRNGKSNGVTSVTVTDPEQRQNRTESEKEDFAPDGASSKVYFFESGVIQLSERDFRKWKESFSNLDLRAELIGLTQWAGQQTDWFFAVSGALAKRNREIGITIKTQPQRQASRVII